MRFKYECQKKAEMGAPVNAFIMSCLFSPPNLLTYRYKTHQRLGVNGGMDALVLCIRYNPPNYPIAKI